MDHCRKLTSWDVYGVRNFPYCGRRKFSPDINRSFYGYISITNDLFGMTIFQFEKEFKKCLQRRKENQQKILNIRFPDKTSIKYFDYLKYEDETIQECFCVEEIQRTGRILSNEEKMYFNLVQTAGTEIEIRTRQRMFIVKDKIINKTDDVLRYISSGSLAEGIDLPGSDIDIMSEKTAATVIDDLEYLYTTVGYTTFLMELDVRYPGFCKLRLVSQCCFIPPGILQALKETNHGIYISSEKEIKMNKEESGCKSKCIHGPCISDKDQYYDNAVCLGSKLWPRHAISWVNRHRPGQWPTEQLINTIVKEGCLFVPIGPKNECDELFWRISFSLAEKRLTHSMNYTQLLCYVLLKLSLKKIINKNEGLKDLLCSYFLKTSLFWLSEELNIDTFRINNLSNCFSLCVGKLMSFVRNCNCPNYFIPEHNMFIDKVNTSNNGLLLDELFKLRNTELKSIISKICENNVNNHSLCTMLDSHIFYAFD